VASVTPMRTTTATCLAAFVAASAVAAQQPAPRPAARVQFDTGTAALKRHDAPRAVAAFRKAIAIDPSYYDAHDSLMPATRRVYEKADTAWDFDDSLEVRRHEVADSLANTALTREYERWAAQKPKVAAYQWVLGTLNGESPAAEPYYLKAVALDSKLARAYAWLSRIAEFRGDNAASTEYVRQASEADPQSPQYALAYADKFARTDPARFRTICLDVAQRFPMSDGGAKALSRVGRDAPTDSAGIAIYEQLRSAFPPDQIAASRENMWRLFDLYVRTAPDKALSLAQDMLQRLSNAGDQREWAPRVVFAQNVIMARSLMGDHRYAAASAVLGATQVPTSRGNDATFALMKAEAADGAANTQTAYDSLVVRFAKAPSDTVRAAIARYGVKLGKNAAQADSDVWARREQTAKPAAPFRLASYQAATDSVSLADHKGKVVLLTFWFPGCSSCRAEFPHFQKVANQFQERPFAYVGINVEPTQDAYVLPFLRGTQYTFTPLRASWKFAQDAYQVSGTPTNFLIDGQGRIIFAGFAINDGAGERMLTLMIESMLAHTPSETSVSVGQ
jgi:thiol-disulfide isomerase/thioredoxin/Tfp pilus assembly protein PilF